jgi:hypothetical protein
MTGLIHNAPVIREKKISLAWDHWLNQFGS